ncbi:hypothetical protein QWZ13_05970 [Reinekea marina]|nr:hypothetical protein [Reinekea marina]MDN3648453.1 hypothetical protein [Reinekea marina]
MILLTAGLQCNFSSVTFIHTQEGFLNGFTESRDRHRSNCRFMVAN